MRFYKSISTVRALSFDLDDTLYLNAPIIAAAESAMIESLRISCPDLRHNDSYYWQLQRKLLAAENPDVCHDVSQWRLLAVEQGLIAQGYSHCEAQEVAELALMSFLRIRQRIVIDAPIHRLLSQLAERFALVAITNGNADLKHMGLASYFQFALRAGPDGRMKPYPDLFERAASRLQLPLGQILHIGDHVHSDVLGALQSGAMAAWFNPNGHPTPAVLPHLELTQLHDLLWLSTRR